MNPFSNGNDGLISLSKKLGKRIRGARKGRRLSQRILAGRCGLHVSHLSKIERGVANGTLASFYAIATALQIDLSELFDEPSTADSRETSQPPPGNHA